ncbi:uncharacterized protein N7458_012587 [Penicillium daleae]|uniref:Uncharacterized protein n=1 Tax=Penicillium daleae TaxID=63821 RepID=A0AAD6BUS5_9EURO|nr:uncharacterized protein N7458_012587 [Penicillium daleae]KAJ5433431.1 hypothetical protein N7458_012587 [Penicillium daleae]
MKVATVFLLFSSVLAGALAEPMPAKLATKLPELIPSGLEGSRLSQRDVSCPSNYPWLCDGFCCPYDFCCTRQCCAPGTDYCSNGLCYRSG